MSEIWHYVLVCIDSAGAIHEQENPLFGTVHEHLADSTIAKDSTASADIHRREDKRFEHI